MNSLHTFTSASDIQQNSSQKLNQSLQQNSINAGGHISNVRNSKNNYIQQNNSIPQGSGNMNSLSQMNGMGGMMNSINQIGSHTHGLPNNHGSIGVGGVSSPAANPNNNQYYMGQD